MSDQKIHIGCQAWGYDEWISRPGEMIFYPQGTRNEDKLSLYSEIFDLVELDTAVYGIPPLSNVESWYKKTPRDFFFAPKVPNDVTRGDTLGQSTWKVFDEFCERMRVFREKLAPILILLSAQFEPTARNIGKFRAFITRLPSDLRFAVEFRNPGWLTDPMLDLMTDRNVALCLTEGYWISKEDILRVAARPMPDFAYIRLSGPRDITKFDRVYRNQDRNLAEWAELIRAMPSRDVFILIANFYEGHSPASANKLKALLGIPVVDPATLERQGSLF